MLDNKEALTEYDPALDPGTLVEPQQVSVRFDLSLEHGQLNFIPVDTTPWPPGSKDKAVTKDSEGSYILVVERGQDRIFAFELNSEIDWAFDPASAPGNSPVTFKRGSDAALYAVRQVDSRNLLIYAKARPNPPARGALDHANYYVTVGQATGVPIALRIDPGTGNPP